jgi:hypothetical protein
VKYQWPVSECLHEHKQDEEVLMSWQGGVERTFPAWCPECGYKWPVEPPE